MAFPKFPILSILLLCLVFLTQAVFASIHPGIVYDPPEVLFPGLVYYEARDLTVPWQIRILEMELDHPNLKLTPAVPATEGSLEKVSSMAVRGHALAAVNAGFFGGVTSVSHVQIDHTILSNNPSHRGARSTFGLSANHQTTVVQTRLDFNNNPVPSNPQWSQVINAIGGGPQLVKSGTIAITDVEEELTSLASRNPRTAFGWCPVDRRLWIVVVDGRRPGWSVGMTFIELAGLMLDLGAHEAMNYDGGGSSTMWVNGEIKNRPSDNTERSVASAWLVVPAWVIDDSDEEFHTSGTWSTSSNGQGFYNQTARFNVGVTNATGWARWIPDLALTGFYEVAAWWPETQAANEMIVDNLDPGCTISGSWFVSANPGFYGTNSLYSFGGTGMDTVTWRPSLTASGVYAVDAWWVSSTNRTSAAPYTVFFSGGSELIPFDQRTGGGTWHSMGTFPFDPSDDPRVVLSDAGVDPDAIVSADAVRFRPVASGEDYLALFQIVHRHGTTDIAVDQSKNGGVWNVLGTFSFTAGSNGYVQLLQSSTDGALVSADAVRLTFLEPDLSQAVPEWTTY